MIEVAKIEFSDGTKYLCRLYPGSIDLILELIERKKEFTYTKQYVTISEEEYLKITKVSQI